jgi:hypothetical protein
MSISGKVSVRGGAIRSSETSLNATTTQRHIPEDDILHVYICLQIMN